MHSGGLIIVNCHSLLYISVYIRRLKIHPIALFRHLESALAYNTPKNTFIRFVRLNIFAALVLGVTL